MKDLIHQIIVWNHKKRTPHYHLDVMCNRVLLCLENDKPAAGQITLLAATLLGMRKSKHQMRFYYMLKIEEIDYVVNVKGLPMNEQRRRFRSECQTMLGLSRYS